MLSYEKKTIASRQSLKDYAIDLTLADGS